MSWPDARTTAAAVLDYLQLAVQARPGATRQSGDGGIWLARVAEPAAVVDQLYQVAVLVFDVAQVAHFPLLG